MMKTIRWKMMAAALVAANLLWPVRAHAGLFKLDFSTVMNSYENVTLTNWDTFSDWAFTNFPGGIATWKLTDFSVEQNTNVTLTIMDNAPLAAQLGVPAATGMSGNSPDPQGLDVVYDGVNVPAAVKDDYYYRELDTAGTEMLFRFANLAPGQYHVTVFDGRVSDVNGQYGKIWIDDINGNNEPAAQNTGDFSANPLSNPNDPNSDRVPTALGHPQTLVVNIKAGDYLWYAHMEDGWGGISGMIIRSWVDSDGDGMPDDWELQYGLNPHDPSDAAKDPNGNGLSNLLEYQSALDPSDTTRPTIRSVVANSWLNEVVVTFSKPLFTGSIIANDPRDPTIATNLANYSISPALAIAGAAVGGNVVRLTTAPPSPGVTAYTLTVNNVRDVNNWPVAPNTKVTFSMGGTPSSAQPLIYRWLTIAGKAGTTGSVDGTNSAARFYWPDGVAVDSAGNLFVADNSNATIRKLMPQGTNWVTTTIAGKALAYGSADGTNSNARFGYSSGGGMGQLAVDSSGNVYVADFINNAIRKIAPVGTDWVTTTIAGKAGTTGSADGTNSAARFNGPNGITVDAGGNLFVADAFSQTIRKLTPVGTDWVTTTIAGSVGQSGSADGTNSQARFNFGADCNPAITVDRGGNVLVTDHGNHTIRKLTPEGANWVTTTIAGKAGVAGSTDGTNSAARFNNPFGIAVDGIGNVIVADFGNHTIRKLMPAGTNWLVTTIGGKALSTGIANGTNSAARFAHPACVAADSAGNVYVADADNNTIRKGVPLPLFQSVTPVNGSLQLIVNAAPGQTVQLQYSSDLTSTNWTNLGSPITATSGTISVTDTPGPDRQRFYRIIVQP